MYLLPCKACGINVERTSPRKDTLCFDCKVKRNRLYNHLYKNRKCEKCGYEGKIRDPVEHTCKRCSYKWLGRTDNPKNCSQCHSPSWNKEKPQQLEYLCKKCGNKWLGKNALKVPKVCPKCHVYTWNNN